MALASGLNSAPADPAAHVLVADAAATAVAAELLAGTYTLVVTNVPYLKRASQDEALRALGDEFYDEASPDLATMMQSKCLRLASDEGTVAIVISRSWLFLPRYEALRQTMLGSSRFALIAGLGSGAFEAISGEVVNVILEIIHRARPVSGGTYCALDVSAQASPRLKSDALMSVPLRDVSQDAQRVNPGNLILLSAAAQGRPLGVYARSHQGVSPADLGRFGRLFWELPKLNLQWRYWQGTPDGVRSSSGRSKILWDNAALREAVVAGSAYIRGREAWGRRGVVVGQMGALNSGLYTGEWFDTNVTVLIPYSDSDLSAIFRFATSGELRRYVRMFDHSVKVTNSSFEKVPFDAEYWRRTARSVDVVSKPWSDDPTQWLFEGRPAVSTAPLQVAVARLGHEKVPTGGQVRSPPVAK